MLSNVYTIRRKFFSFPHTNFHVYDEHEQVVLYCRMKAFRLKEDIRIYAAEDMQQEVLRIRARSVFDFGATYDVFDAKTDEHLGALRRKAMKSFLRDEWAILDPHDTEIGMIQEDSMTLALIRRGIGLLIDIVAQMLPQQFTASIGGQPVGEFRRHLNPFILKMDIDFTPDIEKRLDQRLGFAAGLLLSAVEGRQD